MMMAKSDVVAAVRRFLSVYPLRQGTTFDGVCEEWFRALRDLSSSALDGAVDLMMRSTMRWFPTPGQVRDKALEWRSQHGERIGDALTLAYREWELGSCPENNGAYAACRRHLRDGAPCPVCQSVLACLGCGCMALQRCKCVARVAVKHDHQRHIEAGIAYAGIQGIPTGRPHQGRDLEKRTPVSVGDVLAERDAIQWEAR